MVKRKKTILENNVTYFHILLTETGKYICILNNRELKKYFVL